MMLRPAREKRAEEQIRRVPLVVAAPVGLLVLLFLMVLSVSVGPLRIDFADVFRIVGQQLGIHEADGLSQRDVSVVWQLRFPRTLLGALVGAALAMSGAALQSLFNNPLADPGIIGVTGGATTGAVAVIVLLGPVASDALTTWAVPVGAFLAGLAVTALIYVLARPGRATGTSKMLLVGIALGSACAALTGFFTYIADDTQLQTLVFWQLGSLSSVNWGQLAAMLPVAVAGVVVLVMNMRNLDVLALGERQAQHLGVNVKAARMAIIVAAALLAGGSVAFVGSIGFVGLVVPHIVRQLVGPAHRVALPMSAIVGACLIVASDCAARTLNPPSEIPLGLFTAAVGAPVFLYLVVRAKKSMW